MFKEIALGREFFEGLTAVDAEITAAVAAEGCPRCGGPLHRSDHERKPRGGLFAAAAEAFRRRFSLCCGREGCRRRALPPSVRFLGRRVYVAAVVVIAAAVALAAGSARAARAATGIPTRTTRRWADWWTGPFVRSPVFATIAGRIVAIERERLPTAILEATAGAPEMRVRRLLTWLAPLTTESIADGARFVRAVV